MELVKSILKNIYYIILHQNYNLYQKEDEWSQSLDEKITYFFEDWALIYNMEPDCFGNDSHPIEPID